MAITKALIIYVSFHHQNTVKIARAIGGILDAKSVRPFEVDFKDISRHDLIGFGSGVYFGKYHRSLINLAENLPDMSGKKAFIFSTSGLRELPLFNRFNAPFRNALIRQGFKIIGEFHSPGWDTFGPLKMIGGLNKGRPNQRDLDLAAAFARRIQVLSSSSH